MRLNIVRIRLRTLFPYLLSSSWALRFVVMWVLLWLWFHNLCFIIYIKLQNQNYKLILILLLLLTTLYFFVVFVMCFAVPLMNPSTALRMNQKSRLILIYLNSTSIQLSTPDTLRQLYHRSNSPIALAMSY